MINCKLQKGFSPRIRSPFVLRSGQRRLLANRSGRIADIQGNFPRRAFIIPNLQKPPLFRFGSSLVSTSGVPVIWKLSSSEKPNELVHSLLGSLFH